jgi:hypothetical protein
LCFVETQWNGNVVRGICIGAIYPAVNFKAEDIHQGSLLAIRLPGTGIIVPQWRQVRLAAEL